jgi:hypothetical protein
MGTYELVDSVFISAGQLPPGFSEKYAHVRGYINPPELSPFENDGPVEMDWDSLNKPIDPIGVKISVYRVENYFHASSDFRSKAKELAKELGEAELQGRGEEEVERIFTDIFNTREKARLWGYIVVRDLVFQNQNDPSLGDVEIGVGSIETPRYYCDEERRVGWMPWDPEFYDRCSGGNGISGGRIVNCYDNLHEALMEAKKGIEAWKLGQE